MTRLHLALLLVLPMAALAWGGPSSASAQEAAESDDPEAVFLAAARAYGDEDYETAAGLFARAYELRPETSLLLNRGLACERAGMVAEAIAAYEQYLAEAPDAAERADVERSLETLRRQQALQEEVARRDQQDATRDAASPPAPTETGPSGPPSGAAPWIVMGVGVGALVAAVIVGGVANARYDTALIAPNGAEAAMLEAEANDLALAANVLFGVGGGLALIGITWGLIEVAVTGTSDEAAAVSLGPWRVRVQ